MFRSLFVLLLLLLGTDAAHAWGERGHRLIGELAERRLSPAARAQVRLLLRNERDPGLAGVSIWADDLREMPRQEWSVPLHFVNIQDRACRYAAARDCRKGACVVGAIQRYARRLADPALSRNKRAEALKFLVHFVGDVHQPLHAGHRPDQGGNTFQISLRRPGRAPEATNLHSVWDYFILADVGEPFERHAQRLQAELPRASGSPFVPADAARWAEHSCRLTNAGGFYPPRPGKLSVDYLRSARPLAEARLKEAAIHLAQVIETALADAERHR